MVEHALRGLASAFCTKILREQLSRETIRQYVDRLRILKFEVEDYNEDATIMAFQNGLPSRNGLKESLIKHTPFDLCDLKGRAEKYAKVEEESRLLKQVVIASKSSPTAASSTPATNARRSHVRRTSGARGESGASINDVRDRRGMFFKIRPSQILSKI
ncbi:hypothetical protein QJS10_CPA01g01873 [Acorus calamus]|uniref:Uncharacterized protein n=1 Tax=Acorus calamus TaxID=4465 RepID=A0AAV9FH07_ACOCL|nr:hypothetical protein QJS10_CPA01g01873 [Acorus calamus]